MYIVHGAPKKIRFIMLGPGIFSGHREGSIEYGKEKIGDLAPVRAHMCTAPVLNEFHLSIYIGDCLLRPKRALVVRTLRVFGGRFYF